MPYASRRSISPRAWLPPRGMQGLEGMEGDRMEEGGMEEGESGVKSTILPPFPPLSVSTIRQPPRARARDASLGHDIP